MSLHDHSHSLHEQHLGKGVLFGVLAAISITLMSICVKYVGESASIDAILFARFFISFLFITPWLIHNPKKLLHTKTPFAIIVRTLFTLLALACFFYALRFIPLTNALLLNNTFPLFVPIVTWFTGKHRTPHTVWLGILIGFLGVTCILKPDPHVSQFDSLIGLASGIFAAIAIVMIRKLTKTTPVTQILFYNFFLCSLVTGILLPFSWKTLSTETILLLIPVGIFGTAYQLFSTLSYAKTPVRISSSLMFLCIPLGVLANWFLWDALPDALTITGVITVITGGIITIYFGSKHLLK